MSYVDDIIDIGCLRLDCRRRILLTASGEPVKPRDAAFSMLQYLIEQRDRVASKEDILKHVWRGRTVSDNNLTVTMKDLRDVLNAHGGADLILTVRGEGYRFVGSLRETTRHPSQRDLGDDPPADPEPALASPDEPKPRATRPFGSRHPWPIVAILLVVLAGLTTLTVRNIQAHKRAMVPPRLSIAVLPFHNFSVSHNETYMAAAISDDLTTDLSFIPGSVVISSGTAGLSAEIGQVGRALNTRYLVEGSIRVIGSSYRVNTTLIEAATGRHLWAERFETSSAGLADVETYVVRRIAIALDTELTEIESRRAVHDRPDDPDAEDLFFRARAIMQQDDTLESYAAAERLLRKALALHPDFGDAAALLGLALVLKLQSADDPAAAEDLAAARAATNAALSRTRSSIALVADARLYETDGNCAAAEASAQEALGHEPNSIDAWAVLAKCATATGRLDQAAGYVRTVLQLNPDTRRNRPRYVLLSQIDLLRGQYEESIEDASRSLAGDRPPAPGADSMGRAEYARLLLISATALAGNVQEARRLYTAYDEVWRYRSAWRIGALSRKGIASLPGFARFLAGLTAAGMPMYADEGIVSPAPAGVTSDDFSPTPSTIAGATTLTTPQMAARLKDAGTTVLDVGQGAAVPDGALLIGAPGSDVAKRLSEVLSRPATATAVVVMASGAYDQTSVAAVHYCLARGGRRVFWYRGGEEAWAAARMPASDRRSQL